MLGPKQRQLATYVTSANDGSLDAAGQQWKTGESLLRRLSGQLETRSGEIGTDHRFSGESAKAASTAFANSAKKMSDRADEMRDGATAFAQAAHAVRQAQKASDGFAKHAGDQPPQQPPDLGDAAAQRDWKTKNNQFWNTFGDRETQAHEAVTALTTNHTEQAAVFAKIHGETPPPQPPRPTGGNPLGNSTPTTTTHVPTGRPDDTPRRLGPAGRLRQQRQRRQWHRRRRQRAPTTTAPTTTATMTTVTTTPGSPRVRRTRPRRPPAARRLPGIAWRGRG